MVEIKQKHWILGALFLIALSIRLYFAFQTQEFSSDEAYFTLRQVEHIRSTGLPIIHDELSYSGRTYFILPGFYYLLAFFNLFMPLGLVAKIIPNILACTLILIIYLVAKKITNHENISIAVAAFSAFSPLYFSDTINNISVYSFAIPLTFLFIYFFLNINEKNYLAYTLITFAALLVSHTIIIIVIIGMILYLIFLKTEGLEYQRIELEIIILLFFVSLWFYILAFKSVFLFHGSGFIWQNIPSQLFSSYFSTINFFTIFYQIGIIPFIFGIYIIYRYLFREKAKNLYFLISLGIVLPLLITLKLIPLMLGIMLLSFVLLLLFSQNIKLYNIFIEKSKLEKHSKPLGYILFALILATLAVPALIYADSTISNSFTESEANALIWLKGNSDKDTIVVSFPEGGNLITQIAERKNVIDSNFMMIKDIDDRFEDINKIYTTKSMLEAIHLMDKYNASYIFFSKKRLKAKYGISEISYLDDTCFKQAYGKDEVMIYRLECEVKTK